MAISQMLQVDHQGQASLPCPVYPGVQINTRGRPYLGAPIGCREYVECFMGDQIAKWSSELEVLTEYASSQPHAAYSALTKGSISKWSYVARTTLSI